MTIQEFSSAIGGLQVAYNKSYNDQEIKFMYRYFKDYPINVLLDTIDKIVKTYTKQPSLKELIDSCEREYQKHKLEEEYKNLPPITEKIKKNFKKY